MSIILITDHINYNRITAISIGYPYPEIVKS